MNRLIVQCDDINYKNRVLIKEYYNTKVAYLKAVYQ